MKKILYFLLFSFTSCILIYTTYLLFNRMQESYSQDRILEFVQEIAYSSDESNMITKTVDIEKNTQTERNLRTKNLYELYEKNNDLIGWLQINESIIDYPVLKSIEKPDYYLYKDFNKKKSSFGSIYLDINCHLSRSKNLILYGHHMKNGSMFASITKYDDKDYYQNHKNIQFDTLSQENDYIIIGAFKCSASDIQTIQHFIGLQTKDDFDNFKTYFEKHKFYDTDIEYSYENDFLTLMTCEYTYKNGRFFVIAKKTS